MEKHNIELTRSESMKDKEFTALAEDGEDVLQDVVVKNNGRGKVTFEKLLTENFESVSDVYYRNSKNYYYTVKRVFGNGWELQFKLLPIKTFRSITGLLSYWRKCEKACR